jgi:hypothetical protein
MRRGKGGGRTGESDFKFSADSGRGQSESGRISVRELQINADPVVWSRRRYEFVFQVNLASAGAQLGCGIQEQLFDGAVLVEFQQNPEIAQLISRLLAGVERPHVLLGKFIAQAFVEGFASGVFRLASIAACGSSRLVDLSAPGEPANVPRKIVNTAVIKIIFIFCLDVAPTFHGSPFFH